MDDNCKICAAKSVGHIWTRDIYNGSKSYQDAAHFFNIPIDDVMEHCNTHELIIDTTKCRDVNDPDFYMDELLSLLDMFKDWLQYCITSEHMTKSDLDMATKLGKEIRETIKTLGEFQGKLQRGSTINVNVDVINQRYMMITNMLMTEVCDECRLKVINLMDNMEPPKIVSST